MTKTKKTGPGNEISYKKACALVFKRAWKVSKIFQLEMTEIYGRTPDVRIAALYRSKTVLFTILCPIYSQDTPGVVNRRMTNAVNALRVNFPLIPKA